MVGEFLFENTFLFLNYGIHLFKFSSSQNDDKK